MYGQAGRAALNEAQRELLEISRIRTSMSRRYVLLRMDSSAAPSPPAAPGTVIAGVKAEEIGMIDEDDAELEDEAEAELDGEDSAQASKAAEFGTTMKAVVGGGGALASAGATGDAMCSSGVAWEVGGGSSVAPPALAATRCAKSGGISFDVTMDTPTAAKPPGTTRGASGTQRGATDTTAGGDGSSGTDGALTSSAASSSLQVPAQLFGVGRPLSTKVNPRYTGLGDLSTELRACNTQISACCVRGRRWRSCGRT